MLEWVQHREKVLFSKEDLSINRIRQMSDSPNDQIETRIVQRSPDNMIIYLSTHNGCRNACRFCHLTQTGQTDHKEIDKGLYIDQIEWVISQLKDDDRVRHAKSVHINFMARGDALSSPFFMFAFKSIRIYIKKKLNEVFDDDVIYKFKISTIFPTDLIFSTEQKGFQNWLEHVADTGVYGEVEFYYSLYSLFPSFRKKWLPKTLDPDYVGNIFRGHRVQGDMSQFRLHHALIRGENDSPSDVVKILDWLEKHDIECHLNIVRYNPYDSSCGEESNDNTRRLYIEAMNNSPRIISVREIPRVGRDVKASCGTFLEGGI